MAHKPSFDVGAVVSNDEMRKEFKIGNMGGMRKSNTYGCLVIISDHTKGLYEDKWYGDELHYTGMGKVGDQILTGNQNGTLYNANTNGIEVHLFEVLNAKEYTYRGIVKLTGVPYQEEQPDENGIMRKVWMFPVTPISGAPIVSEDDAIKKATADMAKAEGMSDSALAAIANARSTKKPGTRKITTTQVVRDPFIAEYAKRRAKGICQLCGQEAPFQDKDGNPYLESHHIVWLANGGADSIDNTVALCPNCHCKMHVVNDASDVAILQKKVKNG